MTTLVVVATIIVYIYLWVKHRNVAAIITAIPVGLGLIIWGWYYYSYRYPQKQISIEVVYNKQMCSEELPLRVTIINNSNRVISNSWWDIGVYKTGFSSDLSDYSKNDFKSDKIIRPKEAFTYCCGIPTKEELGNPERYEYKIKYSHFTFE
jgi:hypothetical protein